MELLRELAERAEATVEEVEDFLHSSAGRRLRRAVATGLIIAAPMIAQLPAMRASRVGRLLGLAGGAALIVRVAEAIRDWERRDELEVELRRGGETSA
jgi:hypothetical protein